MDIYLPAPEDDDDNPIACGLLNHPLPALQTLKLRRYWEHQGLVPRAVLDKHITGIKSLLLENIPLPQIVDLSLNITSLDLRFTWPGILTELNSFHRFLEKNQNLQSLTLHNCQFPDSAPRMTFSNFRRLVFTIDPAPLERLLISLPPGLQLFFRMEIPSQPLHLPAEISMAGASTLVPSLLLGGGSSDPNPFLSIISGVFGSKWAEATQVVLVIPVEGWEREVVDKLLNRLTRLSELSVECQDDCLEPLFDSLGASEDRCPDLRRIRIGITPEHFPNAHRSLQQLVKRRAEVGITLEVVEQTAFSSFTTDVWSDFLRVED